MLHNEEVGLEQWDWLEAEDFCKALPRPLAWDSCILCGEIVLQSCSQVFLHVEMSP